MKKLLFISLLGLSIFAQAQDTTHTVKTINKDRIITGYLIVTVLENKAIKTVRVNSYDELELLNVRKDAKAKIYMRDIPLDKLEPEEYLKNGVKK